MVNMFYSKRFLFVGRLTKVKNLHALVLLFNGLKDFQLSIVGTGEEESRLKSIANKNINFHGSINNNMLYTVFDCSDFLILPSISETWGLVVEESLYSGLPVMVSENCGSKDLIIDNVNGYQFDPSKIKDLKSILLDVNNASYQKMLFNIDPSFIHSKDKNQVSKYIGCVR